MFKFVNFKHVGIWSKEKKLSVYETNVYKLYKILNYTCFVYRAKTCELCKSLMTLPMTLQLALKYWLAIKDTLFMLNKQ